MARRRSRKTASKIQPIERKLTFQLAPGANHIDVGFALSRLNRKAFRQGYEYGIEKVEVFAESGDLVVGVYRLSSSWVICNAWVKAFSHWKQQQEDWEDDVGGQSLQGAYNDFKIFLNSTHATDAGAPLLPTNLAELTLAQVIDPAVQTDWEYSQVVVPNDGGTPGNTQEYKLIMNGPDVGSYKGMVHNYALSRSRPFPTDPNSVMPTTDGGLYQDMMDVGANLEEVGENVRSHNDQTPYLTSLQSPFEWYPGGANQEAAGLSLVDNLIIRAGTSAYGSDQTTAFTALCGLLKLNVNGSAENVVCQVTLAPGHYKGVMARPMQDVN